MKITYDKKADALNISLKKGRVMKTLEVAPEVFVDFDKKNTPLTIEVLGASEKIGERNFSDVLIGKKLTQLLPV